MSDKVKRALIVVDVQNDFCPGGALGVARGDEVIAPLNSLIEEFLSRGDLVVKSRDWHPPETKHFAKHGGAWPVHCVRNTPGAAFHPNGICCEFCWSRKIELLSGSLPALCCEGWFLRNRPFTLVCDRTSTQTLSRSHS